MTASGNHVTFQVHIVVQREHENGSWVDKYNVGEKLAPRQELICSHVGEGVNGVRGKTSNAQGSESGRL